MISKLRIAIISSHPIQYQVPVYRALANDEEVDVHVFFASDHSISGGVDPGFGVRVAWDVPMLAGYKHTFLRNMSLGKNLNSFWAFNTPGIFRELSRGRFDAVLINAYTPSYYWYAILAAIRHKIPILLRLEASDVAVDRGVIKTSLRKAGLKWLYRRSAACLPIGQNAANHYAAHGVSRDRMDFSPYCVDNALFQSQAMHWSISRWDTRRELGFPDDTFVAIFSGKLIPKKDPFTFIRAASMVKAPIALVFMGDGELRGEAEQLCSDNLRHPFAFVGFQNQSSLGKFFTAADVLVLPSAFAETWGLVVNEAMNFGLPAIVSDRVGCGPDLVKPGETGYVFPRGDAHALARYLEQLALSREETTAMGHNARSLIATYGVDEAAAGIKRALVYAASGASSQKPAGATRFLA